MSTTPREEAALELLRQAVYDYGPRPQVHSEIMERHRREWPTLWRAIDALLEIPPRPTSGPPPGSRGTP